MLVIGPSLVVLTIWQCWLRKWPKKETLAVFVYCSRYTAFFKQRIPFWNKLSMVMASSGSSGGSDCDNSGGGGDGKRATMMAMATIATMAMTTEAVMMAAVTTLAVETMTAVTLVVSTIMAVVAAEMAEKRYPGDGRVLRSRYTAFFKQHIPFWNKPSYSTL